jgi:acylphosphatase
MSTEVIARVLIRGRVQGIGFRAFIQREARRLNLEGWVRNRRTGTLEAMFAGTPEAVDAIVELCRKGPPGAQIEHFDRRAGLLEELALREAGQGFAVLPTT